MNITIFIFKTTFYSLFIMVIINLFLKLTFLTLRPWKLLFVLQWNTRLQKRDQYLKYTCLNSQLIYSFSILSQLCCYGAVSHGNSYKTGLSNKGISYLKNWLLMEPGHQSLCASLLCHLWCLVFCIGRFLLWFQDGWEHDLGLCGVVFIFDEGQRNYSITTKCQFSL